MRHMNEQQKYDSVIETLQKKLKKNTRKSEDAGYNDGILYAIDIIDINKKAIKYDEIMKKLRIKLKKHHSNSLNYDGGYDAGIICAMSKIREVYKSAQKEKQGYSR